MNDLISRSALLMDLQEYLNQEVNDKMQFTDMGEGIDLAMERVKDAPAVDAEAVRHGRWVAVENTGLEEWCAPPIRCGNCGKTMPDVGAAFCPFCGQMNAEVEG